MKLNIGDEAPDFRAVASFEHNGTADWQLSEQVKKGPVVIIFYPRDFEFFSTRQLCGYRDAWNTLKRFRTQIIGVSASRADMHSIFIQAYKLPFALIDDHKLNIFRKYALVNGVGRPQVGLALINSDRIIRHFERHCLTILGPSPNTLERILKSNARN